MARAVRGCAGIDSNSISFMASVVISVEPLIDMGRTAVNVSGSMTAGTVTGRLLGRLDYVVSDI